jgi:hypothetical protein
MDGPPMQTPAIWEYQLSVDDHLAFVSFHYSNRAPEIRRRYLFAQTIPPLICLISAAGGLGLFFEWDWLLAAYLGIFVVGSLLWISFYPRRYKKLLKKLVMKKLNDPRNATSLARCWLSITPQGILTANDVGETRSDWRRIQEVVETENHLFLYIGSDEALVIPRRAFAKDNLWKEFVNTAVQFQAEAHKGDLPNLTIQSH